jgi:hypothetical protein
MIKGSVIKDYSRAKYTKVAPGVSGKPAEAWIARPGTPRKPLFWLRLYRRGKRKQEALRPEVVE